MFISVTKETDIYLYLITGASDISMRYKRPVRVGKFSACSLDSR